METSLLCAWADGPVWQRGRHSRLASEFEGSKLVVRRGGLLQWSLVVGRDASYIYFGLLGRLKILIK